MTLSQTQAASTPLTLGPPGYIYLNTAGGWPLLRREALDGLVIDEKTRALEMPALPGNSAALGPALPSAEPPLAGVSGLAVDHEGNVFLSDTASDLIWRVDGCDGAASVLRSLGGSGSEPGRLLQPRGLAVGAGRLYVADSANHRVQALDLATVQLREVIGQPDPFATPAASDAPGRFDGPLDVAVDDEGHLYVADAGNGRVQKLLASGRADASFAAAWQAQEQRPQQPAFLALMRLDGRDLLLVVDAVAGAVFAFGLDGSFDAQATALWQAAGSGITSVAATERRLYAGDAGGLVHVLDREGRQLGVVRPFQQPGPVAGLAIDCRGRLLARQIDGATLSLEPEAARGRCGVFLLGPVATGSLRNSWQRVSAPAAVLPEGVSVQLFTLASDSLDGASEATTPRLPVACESAAVVEAQLPSAGGLVPLDSWRAAPAGGLDFLALNQPARYLWLAGIFQGAGGNTPSLPQLRVSFNEESWLHYLPAIYGRAANASTFAQPLLLLLESMLDDSEGRVEALPRLFDALAAPDEGRPSSWLDWLAGWLGLDLQEEWPEERRRRAVAGAFMAQGKRGTLESLRELVRLHFGAEIEVTEPGALMSIWSLGKTSTLGFDTMLARAHAQGAVVGSTATLGQSHLLREEEYGAPLFDEASHRFHVRALRSQLGDEADVERLRALVEREKPAHTAVDVCLIEAQMRVGEQALVGIDTIIGGAPGEFVAGGRDALGFGSVLPALPPDEPSLLGKNTNLGTGMTLA